MAGNCVRSATKLLLNGLSGRARLSSDAQQRLYLQEPCILVDAEDNELGSASKADCHSWSNIQAGGRLHRAFSVFLFNDRREMLLQKRSAAKITFPGVWTNACCSHPLFTDEERVKENALGVKRAAQRKLEHELGYLPAAIPLSGIHCVGRVLYQARSDAAWGEHELDYCLIVKTDETPVPNPGEVEAVKFVTPTHLKTMLAENRLAFSPWFRFIAHQMLWSWWNRIESITADELGEEIIVKL